MTCFSKQKGPSPGAAFSPGSEEEIAESHILPPPRSPFLKGGRLGKRPASRVEDHLQGEAARENQSLAALPRQGWRARMNSSARKIPVKKKNRKEKKTSPGKNTSDSSELPRPGARVWRSQQGFFFSLFPSSCHRWAGCRWAAGQRLVRWPHGRARSLFLQVYAKSKLLPLPGGRRRTRDYDSGVFRVVQPPGTLSELVEPVPWAQPRPAHNPCSRNGCTAQAVRVSLALLVISELLGSLWTPGDDSEPGRGLL